MGSIRHQESAHELPVQGTKKTAIVIIAGIVLFIIGMILWQQSLMKTITLIVNGEETIVSTKQLTVKDLLVEQGIVYRQQDRLALPVDAAIRNGSIVGIDHTRPVYVTADGGTAVLYTKGTTVSEIIDDLQLSVDEQDKLYPQLHEVVEDSGELVIVRVQSIIETAHETVSFDLEKRSDPKLLKGKEVVLQEGVEGLIVRRIQKIFEDGTLVSEEVLSEEVQTASMNQIVAVGNLNPVVTLSASSSNIDEITKGGITFGVKKILNNVTLTAYTAGIESTGKTEDHPHYGITYSGTRVVEGKTIAVDPKVIPIGWWVYIEGVGFRRAEDIGSGVKGNWIDVYYENHDYAKKFGLKRGYKVYVIGKDKPVAN